MTPTWPERMIFIALCAVVVVIGYYAPHNFICGLIATGFAYIGVLFHELGHAVFNWLYGYLAIPSIDVFSGGGMTYQFGDRSWLLRGAVWAALAWSYKRGFHFFMLPLAAFLAAAVVTGFLDIHESIIVFMGHGAEAAIAAFLLCRGYYAIWLRRPAERWLNVVAGAFILSNVLTLIWALMYNPGFAAEYEVQKGGHRFGDFHRLQDDLGLPLQTVGWIFIGYCGAVTAGLALWLRVQLKNA